MAPSSLKVKAKALAVLYKPTRSDSSWFLWPYLLPSFLCLSVFQTHWSLTSPTHSDTHTHTHTHTHTPHTHTHTDTSQQISTITQGENCLVFEQKNDMIWFSLQNDHPGCLLRLNGRWVRQMDGEPPGGYWESRRQDLGDSHRNGEYTSEVEPRKSVGGLLTMFFLKKWQKSRTMSRFSTWATWTTELVLTEVGEDR